MPRARRYASNAAKQKAYRDRKKAGGNGVSSASTPTPRPTKITKEVT